MEAAAASSSAPSLAAASPSPSQAAASLLPQAPAAAVAMAGPLQWQIRPRQPSPPPLDSATSRSTSGPRTSSAAAALGAVAMPLGGSFASHMAVAFLPHAWLLAGYGEPLESEFSPNSVKASSISPCMLACFQIWNTGHISVSVLAAPRHGSVRKNSRLCAGL